MKYVGKIRVKEFHAAEFNQRAAGGELFAAEAK